MSLAQALANIIQQEARTRGNLGIAKAGIIPNAIMQGTDTMQGVLNQLTANETQKTRNEFTRSETDLNKARLSRSQVEQDYHKRAAELSKKGDAEGAAKLALEYLAIYEPKEFAELQERGKLIAAQTENQQAHAMAARAQAMKAMGSNEEEDYTLPPNHKRFKGSTQIAENPYEKPQPEKDDIKHGVVTEGGIKYHVMERRNPKDGEERVYRVKLGNQDKPVPFAAQMAGSEDIESWVQAITSGQSKLTDVPYGARGKVNAAIQKSGDLNLPKDVRDKVSGVQQAKNLLAPVKELMDKIIAGEDVVTNSALLENYTSSIATLLSRSLGERGVATEGDVNRAKGLVAGWKGVNFLPEFAKREMALLESVLEAQNKALTTDYFKKVPSVDGKQKDAGWTQDKKARLEELRRKQKAGTLGK